MEDFSSDKFHQAINSPNLQISLKNIIYKTTERVPSSRANLKNAANALHSMCMSETTIPFSEF